jgi:hypothetical protein
MMVPLSQAVKDRWADGWRRFALDCPRCGAPLRRSRDPGALRYVCPAADFSARHLPAGRIASCGGPVSYSPAELVAAARSCTPAPM